MADRMTSEEKARLERIAAKKAERREEAKKFRKEPLRITSLMDALTIILIFLLKSYGSDPMQVPQKKNELILPKSDSMSNMAECVDIQVSRTSIVVKGAAVSKVINGKSVPPDELLNGHIINKLKERLDELRKKAKEQSRSDKFVAEAFIAADQTIPWKLIAQVLYTATRAKYKKFSFAIVKTRGG